MRKLFGGHRHDIGAERRAERRYPLDARERRHELRCRFAVCGVRAHRTRCRDEELLDQEHHVGVVRVRLIPLEHRELGVVRAVDAFIAEVVSDLVDGIEAADDEPLEIQLVGNAQIQWYVERVVVRRERTRGGAAVERLQHRRLDFEKSARVEKGAQAR